MPTSPASRARLSPRPNATAAICAAIARPIDTKNHEGVAMRSARVARVDSASSRAAAASSAVGRRGSLSMMESQPRTFRSGKWTRARSLSSDRQRASGWPVRLRRAWCHEPALVGQDDGLDAVAQAELEQQARHVRLDRALADDELARELRVALAAREQDQDLALALGQPL